MNKIRDFIFKYKVTTTIILMLLASFSVYYFVFASDDIYENQIHVVNTNVNIVDGTANFDSNDDAGNDSANNNKIVRSFDQVTYNISYKLAYKDDSTLTPEERSLDVTRNVVVDVLVPTSTYMEVSEDDVMNVLTPQKDNDGNTIVVDNKYYYYQIVKNDVHMAETSNAEVVLSKIAGKQGDTLSPIIRVRESTDEVASKDIGSNTDVSTIDKLNFDNVVVSARENYGVQLYQGVKREISSSSNAMPVGIMIYIPNDPTKGIKGTQIPSTLSFNLNINSSSSVSNITLSDDPISNYTTDSENVISGMPYSYSSNNGNAAVENSSLSQNSTVSIKFTQLKFTGKTKLTEISDNNSVYYLSTKAFVFNSNRADKNDITYTLSTNAPNSNTLNDYLDNYVAFVGDYVTKIDFFNRSKSTSGASEDEGEIAFVEPGKAVYNYEEEFYIQNTINYGNLKGDNLENGFTNYIKIDNTAIKLEKTQNTSDQSIDYFLQIGGLAGSDYNAEVKYGLGEWNASYFKLKTNRPSYCPSNLSSVSKEDLMNLYGGPCIEDNNIEWVDSIQDAIDANKENKIILFKLDIPDEYETGLQTIVRLRAKAVKNYSNVGQTFEIVSRGQTMYNGQTYYLSEIEKNSVANHSSDMKYNKTTYDANHNITGGNTTLVNGNSMINIGNTILISAFKASINPIELRDAYNSVGKTTFYSGLTDPIEFVINLVIYKSDFESTISGATVSVYLPETLEIYEKTGDKAYNRSTSGGIVSIDGVNYKVYNYDYSESDINFENESASGTIPLLHVHAHISIATPDNTPAVVLARINGVLKPNKDATTTYTDVTPIDQRTRSVNINLRNTKPINSIGKTNVPRVDRNGTYQYNMRTANNSDSDAELSLLYIIPYDGDGIGSGSKFSGSISVSLNALPSGYTAVYTKDSAKTLLNNELNDSSTINWITWSNVTSPLSGATAIKIIPSSNIARGNYFASADGITLNVITKDNKESDKYYNNFYIIQKNADVCPDDDMIDECTTTEKKTVSYSSNISNVSVYNRTISGYAFEDTNYNGFYDKKESRLKNISVDLYKLSNPSFDPMNPVDSISEDDEKIDDKDTVTNNDGYYKFEGLEAGNYYVKYTFNCDKYTVTEKNKVDPSIEGDASQRDSDAQIVETFTDEESEKKTCYAISNILTLDNNNIEASYIDIGLRVRQDFDVQMKKYITNVKVFSNGNLSRNYDYNNETKVKVDVKNLKNTSFKVTYGIEIENNRYFPGTIGTIVETIPDGMTFDPSLVENDGWYESDGNLYYSYLNRSLIMPGEKYHLTIVLDLVTNTGGDYINFVAAKNLQIKPVITDFLEIPEDPMIIPDDSYYNDDEYYDDEYYDDEYYGEDGEE